MADSLEDTVESFGQTALKVKRERDGLLGALVQILRADDEFRASMAPDHERDPVTLACDRAKVALKLLEIKVLL